MAYLLDVLVVACLLVCLRLLRSRRKNVNISMSLPPGPKGLPIIGNLLDMPENEVWKAARNWGETYGSVVHFKIFGTSYIALNSYQSAVDLLEKRGNNFSYRPINTMLKLEAWDQWFMALMQYGDELRRSRQLLHRFLQMRAVGNYIELQTRSVHKMLKGLISSPDKYPKLLRHTTGETILMMAYGYQAIEKDDPYIQIAEKGLEAIAEAECFWLVNDIPWLQYLPAWFPGATFKKIAERGFERSMNLYHEPYRMAKANFLKGTAEESSMLSKLLEAYAKKDEVITDEALIAKVTGVAYAGGADTTVSSLHSFLLAMVLYPEAQHRAQDELDKVLGKDVLPTFDDRPNLPYIEALVKETLRWQPIAPFAVAHTTVEDDEYDGHFIPAGAIILPNIWAMLRDPKEYPEPDSFIPERWLPTERKEPPLDVHKVVFGIGRRICPGRHFANNSIWIGIASLLSVFNISKAHDEHGEPITPSDDNYTPHFVRHPKPFKYTLTPRSDKIKLEVQQAVELESCK